MQVKPNLAHTNRPFQKLLMTLNIACVDLNTSFNGLSLNPFHNKENINLNGLARTQRHRDDDRKQQKPT